VSVHATTTVKALLIYVNVYRLPQLSVHQQGKVNTRKAGEPGT